MYQIPSLNSALVALAESNLPKFSGQTKVCEVVVQFNYGKYTEDWLKGEDNNQHIKVVFFHPGNSMLVGYSFETNLEDIPDDFMVSANHSSTWKHDGLNFFHTILEKPESWKILETNVYEIEDSLINETSFTFKRTVEAEKES